MKKLWDGDIPCVLHRARYAGANLPIMPKSPCFSFSGTASQREPRSAVATFLDMGPEKKALFLQTTSKPCPGELCTNLPGPFFYSANIDKI